MTNRPCQFNERFLQIIWNEKLLRQPLVCTDGADVRPIAGGRWNTAGGPDFREAVLLFPEGVRRGDIEAHRRASDWLRHGHQHDPAYSAVILHLVWHDDWPAEVSRPPGLRTLLLGDHLLPSWQRFLSEMDEIHYPRSRQIPPGSCAIRWALADNERVRRLLEETGDGRCASKGGEMRRRAAVCGFGQMLYEETFAALGYSNNSASFRRLAEQCPLESLRRMGDQASRAAWLFGSAGFLPDLTREKVLPALVAEVRAYWHRFWQAGGVPLGLSWQQAGGRPCNSCQRRLQGGILWLEHTGYDPEGWLLRLVRAKLPPRTLQRQLLGLPEGSTVWQGCRDFSHPLRPPAALLGHARALDLAVNIFVPAALAWCEKSGGEDAESCRTLQEVWRNLPATQGNRRLTEASLRFLAPPSRSRELLRRACQQQGLLDLYQKFCLALNSDCSQCPFRHDPAPP